MIPRKGVISTVYPIQRNSTLIIIIYNIINLISALFFYPLIPFILNYPPGIIENSYLRKWLGLSYSAQYGIIIISLEIIGTFFLIYLLKEIRRWEKLSKNDNINNSFRTTISRKCIEIPYNIYFMQLILPVLIIWITYFLIGILKREWPPISFTLSTAILIFTFEVLNATYILIVSKNIFRNILLDISNDHAIQGYRIDIKNKILIFTLPLFIGALLFTAKLGHSTLVSEKGDYIYHIARAQLIQKTKELKKGTISKQRLIRILKSIKIDKINVIGFFITPYGEIDTSNGSILDFTFQKYLDEIVNSPKDRIYDLTSELQGTIVRIQRNGTTWIVGVKYDVVSYKTVFYWLICISVLFLIIIVALYIFSQALANDMSSMSISLIQIAEGKNINLNEKLAVTSNDEIGDLVVAFNKIQELEKEHIRKIEENQAILVERERLASLGHLIGGIAHNLKTPIMSISGGTEALKDLIKEYSESVDDNNVTTEDHIEISQEMQKWVDSIKTHCAYMSEIISAVREQAVQMNYSENQNFTVEDLVKRVETLLKYELKKNHCPLQIDIRVPDETVIQGEETNLVQVLNNLIVNAIQSYGPKGGPIDLIVEQAPYGLEFILQDHGKGIPNKIKDRLFKEMVTTKGKQGTGLGLYMSYLTIKGKFGGNMWFESAEDQGTSFHIAIPL